MLGQFTWGQFLCCYGAASLLWYLGLLFTAYRKDFLAFVSGKHVGGSDGILRLAGAKKLNGPSVRISGNLKDGHSDVDEQGFSPVKNAMVADEAGEGKSLMGKANLPEGLERIEMGQLAFSPRPDVAESQGQEAIDGGMSGGGLQRDLTDGVREIYSILAANDGNKHDFFGMVADLKTRLGPVGSSPCIPAVNTFIRETAPFAISQQELEDLWV